MTVEWREEQIGNICKQICSGGTPKSTNIEYYTNGTIPWLNTKEINFNRIFHTEKNITEKALNSSSAKWIEADSIIVALYGETAGKVAITKIALTTNQACCNLTIDPNKADYNYIYYFLKNKNQSLINLKNGGAQQNLNVKIIKEFSIRLPPLPVQKKIASILSSLDDKIELNTRMNNVLEEIARALFHRWFVEFEFPNAEGKPYKSAGGKMVESEMGRVPEGWKVGTIGEIANITMGQSPSGDSYNEEGKGEVFYQGRAEFGSRFPTRRLFTTEPKRMAEKGAVLMSVRAPVGDLNIATEKCCIGRGVAAIQSMDNHPSFILYTMINLKRELNVFNGEGTVFGSINKASLHAMQILIPSENIIDRFEKMVSPLDVMIENNYNEAQRLTGIRDGLLPKLMNGELSI